MSGGYFNYLCGKDAADLLGDGAREDLHAMASALRMRADGAEVADATFAVLQDARESLLRLQSRIDQLRDVWKALEWKHSGDWGEERVRQAITDYRARHPSTG